ncbi:MAG: ABC transporter permease [Clostridia bacterium]|nr:ABC transporter permease [Clostridia bacterium]
MESLRNRMKNARELVLLLVVLVMFIGMCFASPYFFSSGNLLAVLLSLSLEAIMAVGMVSLMVSGGFDMSIGSNVALSGCIVAMMIKAGAPVWLSIVGGLGTGCLVGLFNGLAVAKLGIVPFVTTLASQSMARGLVLVFSSGKNISGLPESYTWIGQAKLGVVQMPVVYMVVIVIIGSILLSRSRFFRQNYYIGGNIKAAKLSGIHVDRITVINYVIMGLLAGIAGVVLTARLGAASTTAGSGMEMKVITAVIIGGASMSGGEGTVVGAFLGCILMALISNAMTLLNVSVYWQTFITGFTLIVAVLIDRAGKMKQEKNG